MFVGEVSMRPGEEAKITNTRIVRLPMGSDASGESTATGSSGDRMFSGSSSAPLALLLTSFHVFLLYRHELVALDRLNFEVAHRQGLDWVREDWHSLPAPISSSAWSSRSGIDREHMAPCEAW